jgi:predicted transcriptional regulator
MIIREIEEKLKNYGFKIFVSEYSKSFEIIAKNKEKIIAIKKYKNVDVIPKNILNDLKNLENFIGLESIIIGEKTARKELKDCIYFRGGVKVISFKYFEDFITEKIKKVYSYGKEVVNIDVEKMKKLREEKGISLNVLSKLVGISKNSLIKIEKRIKRPTIETCRKIERILNCDLTILPSTFLSKKNVYYFSYLSFYKGEKREKDKIIYPKKEGLTEAKKLSNFLDIKLVSNENRRLD